MFADKSVLVVDDEKDLRGYVAQELNKLGCRVVEAASGKEGLKLANSAEFDLIISDLNMPDMHGTKFLGLLKTRDSSPPVIIVTGETYDFTALFAEFGIIGILQKPFFPDEIRAVITKAFSRRGD